MTSSFGMDLRYRKRAPPDRSGTGWAWAIVLGLFMLLVLGLLFNAR